jgi:ATP-dependent Clp protease ATP-binding subunit ClpB
LDNTIQSFPKVSGGEVMLSRDANKALIEAEIIAKKMNDEFVLIAFDFGTFSSKAKFLKYKDQGVTEKD